MSCRHLVCVLWGFEFENSIFLNEHILKREFVKPNLFISGLFIFSFLLIGTAVGAAETDAGKEAYIQYCGSCHGEDGRGGGPVSAYLKVKVPDLSLLKKNNKGIYPMDNVMSAIDRRRTVRAARRPQNVCFAAGFLRA
jgi:hypothetical protein